MYNFIYFLLTKALFEVYSQQIRFVIKDQTFWIRITWHLDENVKKSIYKSARLIDVLPNDNYFLKEDSLDFFMYFIQHCFFCCPLDSTVSEDTGIEPSARSHSHSARSHPQLG
jgi:hypothetical protein